MFKHFFGDNHIFFNVKHRKREPEGVHGQLEGCNRNLGLKAAVAKVWTHGKGAVSYRILVVAYRILVDPQPKATFANDIHDSKDL